MMILLGEGLLGLSIHVQLGLSRFRAGKRGFPFVMVAAVRALNCICAIMSHFLGRAHYFTGFLVTTVWRGRPVYGHT